MGSNRISNGVLLLLLGLFLTFAPVFDQAPRRAVAAPQGIGPIGRGLYTGAGAPTSSTLKTGIYFLGDRYIDTTNQLAYTCVKAGTASTSVWSGGGGGGGGSSVITWQQIATHTTGTAEASFTWSGLNGDADVEYMIVGKAVSTGTGDTLYAQPNADATTTHYHTQEVVGNNATPSAGALQADVGLEFCGATADAGSTGRCILHLYAKSGYNRPAVAHWGKGATATSRTVVVAPLDEWIDTASNITSLKVITSAGGANIGVGSYFELWALRPITIGQPTLVTKDGNGNGTDYTTASTSYQDVDATNLAYTATIPNGSKATSWYDVEAVV